MSDAIKLAIEALESCTDGDYSTGHVINPDFDRAMVEAALAALRAQPVPEVGFGNIAQSTVLFKKLSDAQVLWLAESHGIDVYASNPLAFYADLISTTPAQPDHSELVKNAARYRWLREQHWSDSKFAVVSNPKTAVNLGSICPSRELLDEAIDAAIGETME